MKAAASVLLAAALLLGTAAAPVVDGRLPSPPDRAPSFLQYQATASPSAEPTAAPTASPATGSGKWVKDPEASFYGPGFYGRRTACGKALTKRLIGVAHRTLKCGTLVAFRYKGVVVVAPVVDRGPYIAGRTWDLTGGLCTALGHCWTGPIEWRLVNP